ncbi:MAG: hypothetical protein HYX60_04060, partial [Legionella longbeachae]|nr:hypothetical protein [Legionella longbeachae]
MGIHQLAYEKTDEKGEKILISSFASSLRSEPLNLGLPNPPMIHITGANEKASPEGIQTLANDFKKMDCLFHFTVEGNEDEYYADTKEAVVRYQQSFECFKQNKTLIKLIIKKSQVDPSYHFVHPNDENFEQVLSMNSAIKKTAEISSSLTTLVSYYLSDSYNYQLRLLAEELIYEYNQSIKNAQNAKEEIMCIIKLVKGLLNLHVWLDGNGRLCAHHLTNLLLIQNTLYPTMLEHNCFDAYTHEELYERISKGMNKFRSYLNNDINNLIFFNKKNAQLKEIITNQKKNYTIKNDLAQIETYLMKNNMEKVNSYFKRNAKKPPLKLLSSTIRMLGCNEKIGLTIFFEYFKKHLKLIVIKDEVNSISIDKRSFFRFVLDQALSLGNKNLFSQIIDHFIKKDPDLFDSNICFKILSCGDNESWIKIQDVFEKQMLNELDKKNF